MALSLRTVVANGTKLVGMMVPIGVGLGLGRLATPYLPQITAWVETLGVWAPAAFIASYVVASVFMLPAFLLIITAGAVFGVVKGAAYALLGATIGGTVAFLLGRTVLRGWVAAQIARNDTLTVVDRVIGQEGLRLMLLLRMSGVVPFVLTNYALGVTTVSLRDFVIAMVGMIPTVATFAMIGTAGIQAAGGKADVPQWILWMGIASTLLLAVLLTRIAQRAIKEAEARQAMAAIATAGPQ